MSDHKTKRITGASTLVVGFYCPLRQATGFGYAQGYSVGFFARAHSTSRKSKVAPSRPDNRPVEHRSRQERDVISIIFGDDDPHISRNHVQKPRPINSVMAKRNLPSSIDSQGRFYQIDTSSWPRGCVSTICIGKQYSIFVNKF